MGLIVKMRVYLSMTHAVQIQSAWAEFRVKVRRKGTELCLHVNWSNFSRLRRWRINRGEGEVCSLVQRILFVYFWEKIVAQARL